jgi:hypothetical protein
MLVGYLRKLDRRLSTEQIDQAHAMIAQALLEHRTHGRNAGVRVGGMQVQSLRAVRGRLPAVRGRGGR